MYRLAIMFALALVVAFASFRPAAAQAPEEADCSELRSSTQHGVGQSYSVPLSHLREGERVTFGTTVIGGVLINGEMFLSIDGSEVGRRNIPGVLTWDVPADGTYDVMWGVDNTLFTDYTMQVSCAPIPETEEEEDEDSDTPSGPVIGSPCNNVFDSRINNSLAYDCAAPVAVYIGSIDVYGIHPQTGEGLLLLHIEDDMLTGDAPATNTLLGETVNPMTGQPIHVYRLTSDEIYLATAYADGKPYIIVWQNGSPDTLYHVAA